jgi:CPA1 family monovalent cation:H+ antiporter
VTAVDTLLTVGALMALTALFGVLNERYLRLQPSIGLMLLALVMTAVLAVFKSLGVVEGLAWTRTLVERLDLSEVLLNGVLCFMLFAGSTGVKISLLRQNEWPILTLAIGSTIIGCAVVGALLSTVLGWFGVDLPVAYALVFGALISPTDPIAALAILKPAGLPDRLETIINGESLFNDGVGVVLFTLALTAAQGTAESASAPVLFLREVLGGVGLGLAVGLATHWLLLRTNAFVNQLLITLATVALGYGLALGVDVSGPIAMVVAGLFVGNVTAPRLTQEALAPLSNFWDGIDGMLNSMLFVMMGLTVVLLHDLDWAPLMVLIPVAIVVCLIARAVSVGLAIAGLNATPVFEGDAIGLTKLFTWAGLRGGLALALALSLPESEEKPVIINMTFAVVAFSVLVQGSTIAKLFSPDYLKGLLRRS